MHSAQLPPRSLSSNKKNRTSRDAIETFSKVTREDKENSYLLASKFGDLSQRNQTTYSRELDSRKQKNQAENTQYIRNLYKKYLGKESNVSDRKNKTDVKDREMERVFDQQNCRQEKLTYGATASEYKPHKDKQNTRPKKQDSEQSNKKIQLFKKMSEQTHITATRTQSVFLKEKDMVRNREADHCRLYECCSDGKWLQSMGDQNNSLVQAMNIINGIKRKYQ